MKILSIETSCDETAISLVETQKTKKGVVFNVLGNELSSQIELHAKYGGVFPMMAKREHAKNIVPILEKVLKEAGTFKESSQKISPSTENKLKKILEKEHELYEFFINSIPKIKKPNIDLIAVTSGPGLEPALWVGINFAKALSLVWDIPVSPINHMEGHIVSSFLSEQGKNKFLLEKINYPLCALLISGGHTELVISKKPMNYKVIGETRDDAVGEAFDKVARMLGLPYPGGPQISKLADLGKNNPKYKLPRPMINSKDFDFSFSGLKTAVLYMLKEIKKVTPQIKKDIAREFEDSVTEVLLKKTLSAVKIGKVKTLILGGGVSANKKIRTEFTNKIKSDFKGVKLYLPNPKMTTDNALMIAVSAYFKGVPKKQVKIVAEGNMHL